MRLPAPGARDGREVEVAGALEVALALDLDAEVLLRDVALRDEERVLAQGRAVLPAADLAIREREERFGDGEAAEIELPARARADMPRAANTSPAVSPANGR